MKIRILTPMGVIVLNLPNSNLERYSINEYCEEIMECNR